MKILKMVSCLTLTGLFLGTYGNSVFAAQKRSIPVQNVYTPAGFDSNDNSQIIISGYMPNYCYNTPQAIVDTKNFEINVRMEANYNEEGFCQEATKEYLHVLDLGKMKPGHYQITIYGDNEFPIEEEIEIAAPNAGEIDRYQYPVIHNVSYNHADKKLLIKGYKPSSCYELVDVEFYSDRKNTIIALPILEKVSNFCPKKMVETEISIVTPRLVNSLQTLIHIRSEKKDSKNLEVIF